LTSSDLTRAVDDPDARSEFAVEELVRAFLHLIETLNPVLNAFISVQGDRAIAAARAADRRHRRRALEGVVLAVKDNIAVAGAPMTSGSVLYERGNQGRTATAVRRLLDAGAIVIGKANLHELAMGSTSDNPFFGPCRNPWDTTRSPGGSSGGSAVAVAADLCLAALGTDTGGSIRNPAAICGVTGLRPTVGLISNRGIVPVAPAFDTVGAMARSARDVFELHRVMTGSTDRLSRRPRVMRIGVAEDDHFNDHLSEAVNKALKDAERQFGELGMRIVRVELENIAAAESVFFDVLKAQAAASHRSELRRRPEGFSDQLRRLLLASELKPSEIGERMVLARAWRQQLLRNVFSKCDMLLTPLQLEAPLKFQDTTLAARMGRAMRFTFPWSFAQLPAISIPCGAFPDGLPIGCQLVGPPNADTTLLEAAVRFQESTVWHLRRPPPALN
jgi:aspartyl-tRNA(Asn)/glutamyl-tRNA(Gln) amidotransferase subunit A